MALNVSYNGRNIVVTEDGTGTVSSDSNRYKPNDFIEAAITEVTVTFAAVQVPHADDTTQMRNAVTATFPSAAEASDFERAFDNLAGRRRLSFYNAAQVQQGVTLNTTSGNFIIDSVLGDVVTFVSSNASANVNRGPGIAGTRTIAYATSDNSGTTSSDTFSEAEVIWRHTPFILLDTVNRTISFDRNPNYRIFFGDDTANTLFLDFTGWSFRMNDNLGGTEDNPTTNDDAGGYVQFRGNINLKSGDYFGPNTIIGGFQINTGNFDSDSLENRSFIGYNTDNVEERNTNPTHLPLISGEIIINLTRGNDGDNRIDLTQLNPDSTFIFTVNGVEARDRTTEASNNLLDAAGYIRSSIGSRNADGFYGVNSYGHYMRTGIGNRGFDRLRAYGSDNRVFVQEGATRTISGYAPLIPTTDNLSGTMGIPRWFQSATGSATVNLLDPIVDPTTMLFGKDNERGGADPISPGNFNIPFQSSTLVTTRTSGGADIANTRVLYYEDTINNITYAGTEVNNNNGLAVALTKTDALSTTPEFFNTNSSAELDLGAVTYYQVKVNEGAGSGSGTTAYNAPAYVDGVQVIDPILNNNAAKVSAVNVSRKYLSSYIQGYIPIYRRMVDYSLANDGTSTVIPLVQIIDINVVGNIPNRASTLNDAYSRVHAGIVSAARVITNPQEDTAVPILRSDNPNAAPGDGTWNVETRNVIFTETGLGSVLPNTITIATSDSSAFTPGDTLSEIITTGTVTINTTQEFSINVTAGSIIVNGDGSTISGNLSATTGDITFNGDNVNVRGIITASSGSVTYSEILGEHTGASTASTTLSFRGGTISGTINAPNINMNESFVTDSIRIFTNNYNIESLDTAPMLPDRASRLGLAGSIQAFSGTVINMNIVHAIGHSALDFIVIDEDIAHQNNETIRLSATTTTGETIRVLSPNEVGGFAFNSFFINTEPADIEAEPTPATSVIVPFSVLPNGTAVMLTNGSYNQTFVTPRADFTFSSQSAGADQALDITQPVIVSLANRNTAFVRRFTTPQVNNPDLFADVRLGADILAVPNENVPSTVVIRIDTALDSSNRMVIHLAGTRDGQEVEDAIITSAFANARGTTNYIAAMNALVTGGHASNDAFRGTSAGVDFVRTLVELTDDNSNVGYQVILGGRSVNADYTTTALTPAQQRAAPSRTGTDGNPQVIFQRRVDAQQVVPALTADLDNRLLTRGNVENIGLLVPVQDPDGNLVTTPNLPTP